MDFKNILEGTRPFFQGLPSPSMSTQSVSQPPVIGSQKDSSPLTLGPHHVVHSNHSRGLGLPLHMPISGSQPEKTSIRLGKFEEGLGAALSQMYSSGTTNATPVNRLKTPRAVDSISLNTIIDTCVNNEILPSSSSSVSAKVKKPEKEGSAMVGVRRESPLDLSVKTVRQSADSSTSALALPIERDSNSNSGNSAVNSSTGGMGDAKSLSSSGSSTPNLSTAINMPSRDGNQVVAAPANSTTGKSVEKERCRARDQESSGSSNCNNYAQSSTPNSVLLVSSHHRQQSPQSSLPHSGAVLSQQVLNQQYLQSRQPSTGLPVPTPPPRTASGSSTASATPSLHSSQNQSPLPTAAVQPAQHHLFSGHYANSQLVRVPPINTGSYLPHYPMTHSNAIPGPAPPTVPAQQPLGSSSIHGSQVTQLNSQLPTSRPPSVIPPYNPPPPNIGSLAVYHQQTSQQPTYHSQVHAQQPAYPQYHPHFPPAQQHYYPYAQPPQVPSVQPSRVIPTGSSSPSSSSHSQRQPTSTSQIPPTSQAQSRTSSVSAVIPQSSQPSPYVHQSQSQRPIPQSSYDSYPSYSGPPRTQQPPPQNGQPIPNPMPSQNTQSIPHPQYYHHHPQTQSYPYVYQHQQQHHVNAQVSRPASSPTSQPPPQSQPQYPNYSSAATHPSYVQHPYHHASNLPSAYSAHTYLHSSPVPPGNVGTPGYHNSQLSQYQPHQNLRPATPMSSSRPAIVVPQHYASNISVQHEKPLHPTIETAPIHQTPTAGLPNASLHSNSNSENVHSESMLNNMKPPNAPGSTGSGKSSKSGGPSRKNLLNLLRNSLETRIHEKQEKEKFQFNHQTWNFHGRKFNTTLPPLNGNSTSVPTSSTVPLPHASANDSMNHSMYPHPHPQPSEKSVSNPPMPVSNSDAYGIDHRTQFSQQASKYESGMGTISTDMIQHQQKMLQQLDPNSWNRIRTKAEKKQLFPNLLSQIEQENSTKPQSNHQGFPSVNSTSVFDFKDEDEDFSENATGAGSGSASPTKAVKSPKPRSPTKIGGEMRRSSFSKNSKSPSSMIEFNHSSETNTHDKVSQVILESLNSTPSTLETEKTQATLAVACAGNENIDAFWAACDSFLDDLEANPTTIKSRRGGLWQKLKPKGKPPLYPDGSPRVRRVRKNSSEEDSDFEVEEEDEKSEEEAEEEEDEGEGLDEEQEELDSSSSSSESDVKDVIRKKKKVGIISSEDDDEGDGKDNAQKSDKEANKSTSGSVSDKQSTKEEKEEGIKAEISAPSVKSGTEPGMKSSAPAGRQKPKSTRNENRRSTRKRKLVLDAKTLFSDEDATSRSSIGSESDDSDSDAFSSGSLDSDDSDRSTDDSDSDESDSDDSSDDFSLSSSEGARKRGKITKSNAKKTKGDKSKSKAKRQSERNTKKKSNQRSTRSRVAANGRQTRSSGSKKGNDEDNSSNEDDDGSESDSIVTSKKLRTRSSGQLQNGNRKNKRNLRPKRNCLEKGKANGASGESEEEAAVAGSSGEEWIMRSELSKRKRRPHFGDGSDFRRPGWEEELIDFKKKLRMPTKLIRVSKPLSLTASPAGTEAQSASSSITGKDEKESAKPTKENKSPVGKGGKQSEKSPDTDAKSEKKPKGRPPKAALNNCKTDSPAKNTVGKEKEVTSTPTGKGAKGKVQIKVEPKSESEPEDPAVVEKAVERMKAATKREKVGGAKIKTEPKGMKTPSKDVPTLTVGSLGTPIKVETLQLLPTPGEGGMKFNKKMSIKSVFGVDLPTVKKTLRRNKFKSGFDYIRKKKKATSTPDGSVAPPPKKAKTGSEKNVTEEDVQAEMRAWVLNKSHGETILHRAARLGYPDVAAYCLEHDACPPNSKDNAGFSPLHETCIKGNLEVAKVLLAYGANPSQAAPGGIRPLHEACENGHVELVRLLISYGADPLLATYAGQTPLELAENQPAIKLLLTQHINDVQGKEEQPWIFQGSGSWAEDPFYNGYDPTADPPDESDVQTDGEGFDFESSENPLPLLYKLKGEAPYYILLQDLINYVGKTKEQVLKCHSAADIVELNSNDFLEQAQCCHLLGEKFNLNSSSDLLTLIKYDERVKKMLNIENCIIR